MRKILVGLGVVVLALVGAYAFGFFDSEPAPPTVNATVGECAAVTRAVDTPRFRAVDCGSDEANVKVAKIVQQVGGPCPAGGAAYSTFTLGVKLCLIPNLVEGSCYGADKETSLVKVPCGTAKSVKVVKVLGGGAACGEQRAVVYPEPAVTFCLDEGGA
ncbi:hypothetical protein [Umezawaea sp. Da 62-37]|uniref:LppU/SCO3897 family protein n=1 Tax=Umezawaea sp. Da 62-37 TaxID=3075927 RepID=UPI0028F72566|nr:hypothetical protein [Umezawaea sp. Da 62-37]WNV82004.1 hypothetical protein RM788_27720 [Umezawaea sp. Da 62-37]